MTNCARQDRMELFGRVAYALVVLAVFCEFLRPVHLEGETWQVALVFSFGALYAVLGALGVEALPAPWRSKMLYVGVQTALATAIVWVTPLKGFSGLITMPAASLIVLELSWPWATLAVVELFAAVIGALWFSFGAQAALSSVPSYAMAFVFVVVFSLVTRQSRQARQRAEQLSTELAAANEQLRQHAAQAGELATTRERNRIAREIHDGIGHYLTTINVQLEAARAVLAAQPAQAATALDQAARLSREALEDVRRSVGTLRADAARPPLPETLRALAANLGLSATVRVQGAPRSLPANVEHALFRAAQEGLTNVSKHASANCSDVVLDFAGDRYISLTISDDGRGVAADGHLTKGHGLRGLRERLELLGGTVQLGNRPEGGFFLRVELPTQELT